MNDATPAHPSRQPLDAEAVLDRVHARVTAGKGVAPGKLDWVASTGSTNTDLADAWRAGDAPVDRTIRLADEQVTARGRLGRPWSAPAGAQVIFSALLRPDVGQITPDAFGELPLLVGVAIAEAAREFGVPAVLKWPNDVVVLTDDAPFGYRKLAGILVEAASVEPPVIVAGIGLNVSLTVEEFDAAGIPERTATSVIAAGGKVPDAAARADLAAAEVTHLLAADAAWRAQGAELDDLRRRYRELSATLGTRVRAELPDGTLVTGTAVDLGDHGELVIDTGSGGRRTVTAGDVVHLRPTQD
ncbi:MAG TPA: biotin--[acetyl-CoA-carboxylase] ligase [Candidatus Corynebacterium avicola]|uniref:biotin--[biotin carboxyl-carrier protein] ligase n=1 Tax=Candidatus Corynebacterium avicola TaxID=2838527 RepID=A0A9D1ULJ2_9CORY|nr:biotin--[acetyl-CoA-carboxylase] ligase [Candidatus Corynebacterium avicola]